MNNSDSKLIFLPGMVCDKRLWQYHLECFEDEFETAYVDLQKGNSISEYFDIIHSVIQPHSTLIGFSMGGYVALEYALQFPERVQKLILIGSDPRGFSPARIQQRSRMIEHAKSNTIEIMPAEQLPFYVHQNILDTATANLVQRMAQEAGQEVYLQQLGATLNRENRLRELNQQSFSTHCIFGNDDKIAPSKKLTELTTANISVESIANCGHMIPLEKPTELKILLEAILYE